MEVNLALPMAIAPAPRSFIVLPVFAMKNGAVPVVNRPCSCSSDHKHDFGADSKGQALKYCLLCDHAYHPR